MAGSFSNRKVARAARTGGGPRRSGGTAYGWLSVWLILAILGATLVVFSRNERLDAQDPGSTPPLAPSETRSGDRWFEAYGVYLCDKFAPNIDNANDPYGIRTENDGVIRITPYEKQYAGKNATLGRFARAVDLEIDEDSVQLPNDSTEYGPDSRCGDRPGELVVKEWENPADPASGRVVEGDPRDLLLKNNAAVTIAFVPEGEQNIPQPPSVPTLGQVATTDAAQQAAAGGGGGAPGGDAVQTPPGQAPIEVTPGAAVPGAAPDPAAPAPAPAPAAPAPAAP